MYQYSNPTIRRKKFGLFDEEIGSPKPTGMLNDAETSAYISAKYPMKSEFNAEWAERKGRNPFSGVEIAPQETEPTTGSNPFSGININAPQPNPTDSPVYAEQQKRLDMSPTERAQADFEAAAAAPVKKQGLGKQILFQVLQAVGNVATGQNKDIEFLGNAKKRFAVEQAAQTLAPFQQQETYQQQKALRDAQIKTIAIDDANKQLQIETQRTVAQERRASSALTKLTTLKTYDPKNAAMRRLAQQAGLDPDQLGAWDTRNPIEHSINGVRFRLNRETGKYEQTDLPKDEEQQLVDFKTQDGSTYRVSAKTAAGLKTQFDTLGIRLEQQERQFQQKFKLDVAKFTQAKKEFETVSNLRQQAFDALQKARETNNQQEVERLELSFKKYDTDLENMLFRARKAKEEGELDDSQLADIETFVSGKRQK